MRRQQIAFYCLTCYLLVVGPVVYGQSVREQLQQAIQKRQKRLDTSGDGQISDEERAASRMALAQRRKRDPADLSAARLMKWSVDTLQREALVFLPKDLEQSKEPRPVVFGFHGHGGSAANAARSFQFHKHWPAAIVVYMQGIPTPGPLTDPEGKRNGWQHGAGDQGDRDLQFFDAVLDSLRKSQPIDATRIYASGHSNGGGFTYLLWVERPDVFAAMAPSASASRSARNLKPKPAMHIAGRNDQLVRFAWQQQMIEVVRQVNGCAESGTEWAKDCTLYPSDRNAPLVTLIHNGTHKYPAEAPALIVKFFQQHHR